MNKSIITQWLEFFLFSLGAALLSYVALNAVETEAFHLWQSWRSQQATHRVQRHGPGTSSTPFRGQRCDSGI